MHRLIRIRDEVIGLILIGIYYWWMCSDLLNKRTYELGENLDQIIKITYIRLYIFLWIIILAIILREYILYKRIYSEKVKILYSPNRIIISIRIAIHFICHLLFWRLIHTGNTNYLVLVILSFTIPRLISSSIYIGDKFFMFNGWKYFYSDIEKCKEDALYKIELWIDGQERIINCFTRRRYDLLCDLLRNKTTE